MNANVKDLTVLSWSKLSLHLVVGTTRGNLIIFDREGDTMKTVHTNYKKRIVQLAWSERNKRNVFLATCEDRQVTVFSSDGDMVDQVKLTGIYPFLISRCGFTSVCGHE